MANIQPYTDQIRTARYGEQVRGSIVNALEAMNDDINSDTSSAQAYAQAAAESASSASATATELTDTLAEIQEVEASVEEAEAARVTAEAARADAATGYVAQCKEYADEAKEATTLYGVSKFNDRYGAVVPLQGDYSSDMIAHENTTVAATLDSIDDAIREKIGPSDVITNVTSVSALGTKNDDQFGTGNGRCFLRKINKTVFCSVSFGYSDGIPINTSIFSIPEEYRPTSLVAIPALLFAGTNVNGFNLKVNTDGSVYQNNSSATTAIIASGTWTTN